MTAITQQVLTTPMAPYIGLMRGMNKRDKQIVVEFLNEVMEETDDQQPASSKTNADIIREKYKSLKISTRAKELVEGLSLSEEEVEDERTKYILGL